ncbi:MAG: biotin--[acetyl-CoA-carboxylase] ligase [Mariprofundaceae bacterium]|nr:biotin--[acetyl-CoA-carboxylase] ligase [Mariprofundaceae bacterium]
MHFNIQYFASVDSTNLEAMRQAESGAKEGLVIIAQEQTAGKGRLGRKWHTVEHALAMTVLLRPHIAAADVPKLSLLTAVALHQALSTFTPDIRIKWPNDLLIHGAKVSGILTEMRCRQGQVKAVILGMGINISAPQHGWPQDINQPATDLQSASQNKVEQADVVQAILSSLEQWYTRFLHEGFAPVRQAWWAAHVASQQQVSVSDGQHYIQGTAIGLADDGALRLLVNGQERLIIAGDVSLLDGKS